MSSLHKEAKSLVKKIRGTENRLVEVVIGIEQTRFFETLGHPSLFSYCIRELDLTEGRSYELITVSRKAATLDELRRALKLQLISVSKAARIVSSLTKENAKELVSFASSHTVKETEAKLKKENLQPKLKSIKMPIETYDIVSRVGEVFGLKRDQAIHKACLMALKFNDKRERAERVHAKKKITLAKKVSALDKKRVPLDAKTKHALQLIFGGQCGIHDHNGQRCMNKTFLHDHHITEVQHGGTNELSNLILVCSQHHEMIHQRQFDISGAVNWVEIKKRSAELCLQ